jgi:phenylacetate-CoA ligase
MHIPDEIIVELLDPATGKPVGPGEIGEVVATLANAAYPLIRFATGDLSVYSADPCPCGRTSDRLMRIVGRVDQVTKVKGMFVHPEQVAQIEKKVPGVAALQVVITREGHDDRMVIHALLAAGVSPSDALKGQIAETAREVTRLRGEVVFAGGAELPDKDKKIVDKRKWD